MIHNFFFLILLYFSRLDILICVEPLRNKPRRVHKKNGIVGMAVFIVTIAVYLGIYKNKDEIFWQILCNEIISLAQALAVWWQN